MTQFWWVGEARVRAEARRDDPMLQPELRTSTDRGAGLRFTPEDVTVKILNLRYAPQVEVVGRRGEHVVTVTYGRGVYPTLAQIIGDVNR